MLRVLNIVDKEKSALDRLSQQIKPYMQNITYDILPVHPKRPDAQQLADFEKLAGQADIIDYQYFRTAEMLRQRYPDIKKIPSLLTHHNPYSITESNWNDYQVVIGNNQYITSRLRDITSSRVEHIQNAVDPYFWRYDDKRYNRKKSVIMVANRIESKKGVLPVAQACKQLNIPLHLVGSISDMDYFQRIMQTNVVRFYQAISDEALRDLYYRAAIHVCNSADNFESGTMPILESIFCGTPVVSRLIGHVPEFKDNLFINEHDYEDVNGLTQILTEALSDHNRLERLRSAAWFDIKHHTPSRRAYMYERLYREVMPGTPVSVIVPIADRPQMTRKMLEALAQQTHKNLEIIVVDDGQVSQQELVEYCARFLPMPVRYIRLGGAGYHLAAARNRAIIEATADILVFCDERIVPEANAIEVFLMKLKPKTWLYGNKGVKKDFVENFSCIYRDDLIALGMFNERIEQYGGMSQEIRWRSRKQGVSLEFVENAKATPTGKSGNRTSKRYEIMAMKELCWKIGAV